MIMEQYYFVKPQYIKYYKEVIEGNIESMSNRLDEYKSTIEKLDYDKAVMLRENEQLRNTKKELLEQIKHLSQLNGEYRRERHDMEDKLIESTKPWYFKLKDKLPKLGIRNPFYIIRSNNAK